MILSDQHAISAIIVHIDSHSNDNLQVFLGLFSPVFNIEILDATELAGIVGHKRKLERTGVRRNEKIVRADHRSTRFERSTDLSIVKGCFVRKVQNLDMPQIRIEGSMILLSPG
jgi:hypothetical protein